MSYTPTNWATGDIITADKLNNIEQGIVNSRDLFVITATNVATQTNPQTQPTIDKTFLEITEAIKAGKVLVLKMVHQNGNITFATDASVVCNNSEISSVGFKFNTGGMSGDNTTWQATGIVLLITSNTAMSMFSEAYLTIAT